MKKFLLGSILIISSSISISILCLVAPISSILFGTSINDSSNFLTYLNWFNLVPILGLFSLMLILGLYLTIREIIIDNKK